MGEARTTYSFKQKKSDFRPPFKFHWRETKRLGLGGATSAYCKLICHRENIQLEVSFATVTQLFSPLEGNTSHITDASSWCIYSALRVDARIDCNTHRKVSWNKKCDREEKKRMRKNVKRQRNKKRLTKWTASLYILTFRHSLSWRIMASTNSPPKL